MLAAVFAVMGFVLGAATVLVAVLWMMLGNVAPTLSDRLAPYSVQPARPNTLGNVPRVSSPQLRKVA